MKEQKTIQTYFKNGKFINRTSDEIKNEYKYDNDRFYKFNNLINIKMKRNNVFEINGVLFYVVKMSPDNKSSNHWDNVKNQKKESVARIKKSNLLKNDIDYVVMYYDTHDEIISLFLSSDEILKLKSEIEVKMFISLDELKNVYENKQDFIFLGKRNKDGTLNQFNLRPSKSESLFLDLVKISNNNIDNKKSFDGLLTNEDFNIKQHEKEYLVKIRLTQKILRDKLIYQKELGEYVKIKEQCSLIASHIKPWRLSNDKEKDEIDNVILLDALTDSLFDRGLITFDNNGKIIKSNLIKNDIELNSFLDRGEKIEMNDRRKEFMRYHRENIFKLNIDD